jgi:hypothetical protein
MIQNCNIYIYIRYYIILCKMNIII